MKKAMSEGFTIVEITLAIGYVAFLLVAISTLIVYAINLYQKGLTIRNVNTSGIELVDELSRTISASSSSNPDCSKLKDINPVYQSTCVDRNKFSLVYNQATGYVYIGETGVANSYPLYGVFCTGSYSYAWNTGYSLDKTGKRYSSDSEGTRLTGLTIEGKSGGKLEDFRLIRFKDSDRIVCVNAYSAGGEYASNPKNSKIAKTYQIPDEVFSTARELLPKDSETPLAVYDLTVYNPTFHALTGHTFYSGSFTLGTVGGSIDLLATTDTCQEKPDELSNDFAYCAINKFNFAVRATGVQ